MSIAQEAGSRKATIPNALEQIRDRVESIESRLARLSYQVAGKSNDVDEERIQADCLDEKVFVMFSTLTQIEDNLSTLEERLLPIPVEKAGNPPVVSVRALKDEGPRRRKG